MFQFGIAHVVLYLVDLLARNMAPENVVFDNQNHNYYDMKNSGWL